MIIRNSLTKKHETISPLVKDCISIYSCGPTVYNSLHIGNLSAFIYADILRRSLIAEGYEVKHVMNITDVDDKTIQYSTLQFPSEDPHESLTKLTAKYTQIFKEDLHATGNDVAAIEFISAVDTIPEMITLTQELLDKKIAYIGDDAVYFSITKYYQSGGVYGQLQKVETQQSKARIDNDEYDKENAGDFALWKRALPSEPSWDATFTEDLMETEMAGRPGWHIECSAMSKKLLGVPFDIHTGGIDLKFPHHENEIAQTCGAGAEKLANYFVHNNHVLVDGKKMSKSADNFYTLRDIEAKGFNAQAFRLMVLESHYSSEANFSWDILESAQNRLEKWQSIADLRFQKKETEEDCTKKFIKELSKNLATPQALKVIDLYFDALLRTHHSPNMKTLENIKLALGIELLKSVDITGDQKELLSHRKTARETKDWELSDSLRDELLKQNIAIKDIHGAQIWSRKNS